MSSFEFSHLSICMPLRRSLMVSSSWIFSALCCLILSFSSDTMERWTRTQSVMSITTGPDTASSWPCLILNSTSMSSMWRAADSFASLSCDMSRSISLRTLSSSSRSCFICPFIPSSTAPWRFTSASSSIFRTRASTSRSHPTSSMPSGRSRSLSSLSSNIASEACDCDVVVVGSDICPASRSVTLAKGSPETKAEGATVIMTAEAAMDTSTRVPSDHVWWRDRTEWRWVLLEAWPVGAEGAGGGGGEGAASEEGAGGGEGGRMEGRWLRLMRPLSTAKDREPSVRVVS
mmetsp:Transcript_6257/g.9703  ORF Transcript_6257/g.9703 Transcript_6257/m.9703 type:complete len:289 (-) Transcript_6257:1376-2242(-)